MKFLAVLVVIAIALFQVSWAYPRAEPAPEPFAIPEAFAIANPEPVALADPVGNPEAYPVAIADPVAIAEPEADPEANPAPILALIRCPLPIIICLKATVGRK